MGQKEKIQYLKELKAAGQISTAREGLVALQKKFGSGLLMGVIGRELGFKPRRKPARKRRKKKRAARKSKAGRRKKAATKVPARGAGRPASKGASMGASAPWVVVLPRGRGMTVKVAGSPEEATRIANAALERGIEAERIGIYQAVRPRVETAIRFKL